MVLLHNYLKFRLVEGIVCKISFQSLITTKNMKEVLHFGKLLRYFLAVSARNMTLKTLQPRHRDVKEFFYAILATFLQPLLSTWSSAQKYEKSIFSREYAYSPENIQKRHQHDFSGFSGKSAYSPQNPNVFHRIIYIFKLWSIFKNFVFWRSKHNMRNI